MSTISHLLNGSLAIATIVIPLSAQSTDWVQLNPTAQPVARQNSSIAFDTTRGVSVLFGGWDGSQRRNDTWEWNGTRWSAITTANSPSPRDGMTLTYDALRQVVVCTGGYVAGNQTWEYDGADWTQIATATTHGMGPHRPMIFDFARGVCVLLGQSTVSGLYETWEYDGLDWTQSAASSGPQSGGNFCYDLMRLRAVHFGTTGQTWEYDGLAWTQVTTLNSPPGAGCGTENMVYDLQRQVSVLYGGCPGSTDTWEYDGVDWQQLTTANVPSTSRRYPAMAYDLNRQRTVLFGGRDTTITPAAVVDDTWEYGLTGTLASNTPYGISCGGLTLAGATRPVTNSGWDLELANIPTGSIVAGILFGTLNPNLPLGAVAPGCSQYSNALFATVLPLPVATPAYSFAIPNNAALIGFDLFAQGISLAPGANPLGVWLSAGLLGTVGDI